MTLDAPRVTLKNSIRARQKMLHVALVDSNNNQLSNGDLKEPALIKLYMELTGSNESGARNVFMYVTAGNGEAFEPAGGLVLRPAVKELPDELPAKPAPAPRLALGLLLALLWLPFSAGAAAPAEALSPKNNFVTSPLSLADVVNLALHQNPTILRAQKEVEANQGVVIQTRAVAIPKVNLSGSYSAVAQGDIDQITAPSLTFGTSQNWVSQIKLVQSLYEGGRITSALRAARLLREQTMLNYQTAVADTVLAAQIGYFDVLLAAQQITVQEASVQLLTRELEDTQRRFEAGTVPRFNVLRAEVELANARPRLISARNSLRISKNRLANLLGFNVPRETQEDIPLTLAGKLEAPPYELQLPRALTLALERRSELGAFRKAQELRQEDIVNAKAGYRPTLQAFAGYDVHNSVLSQDLLVERHGWLTGVQMSWNIFDGFYTRGRVKEATANYERAGIELDDATRRIELEVRTAYSNFIEAREVLESQKKVVEEGEEALRLARARNEAGTGTQLDVLSAQTALTEARTTQIQALHDYEVARARLERSIGENVPSPEVAR